MTFVRRQLRLKVLEALEERAKQFRTYEDLYPFRIPHEPLDLEPIIAAALADEPSRVAAVDLRSRTVLRLEWLDDDAPEHAWEAWVIALPSGIMLYCDSGGDETRVLASVKRGSAIEADGFFLELLGESRGEHFGIEMSGGAPDRVRTSIADRDLLVDVLVELYEGTAADASIRALARSGSDEDFRLSVDRWLTGALATPLPSPAGRRRARRLRDENC
jgi:hypothetical protein